MKVAKQYQVQANHRLHYIAAPMVPDLPPASPDEHTHATAGEGAPAAIPQANKEQHALVVTAEPGA